MSGPWISDEPEDPPIPLGLNEMTIPRAAILASLGTIAILLLSIIWLGYGAWMFTSQLGEAFATVDEDSLKEGDRWSWEAMLLFETCVPLADEWTWPGNLSAQDDIFWLPGEVSCEWEHQGSGDRAIVAVNNAGNETLDLQVSIDNPDVTVTHPSGGVLTIDANTSEIVALYLSADVDDALFNVTVAHATVTEARVNLQVHLFADSNPRAEHSSPGQRMNVHYQVWDYDTGESLDEGDLPATAGEDPMCDTGAPWVCYIKGFGWGLVGLDCDIDRCFISTGSSHKVLLPPELAYGDRPGHQLENSWLLFELRINDLFI